MLLSSRRFCQAAADAVNITISPPICCRCYEHAAADIDIRYDYALLTLMMLMLHYMT